MQTAALRRFPTGALLLGALVVGAAFGGKQPASSHRKPVPAPATTAAAPAVLPLPFELNKGQTGSTARFLARSGGGTFQVTPDGGLLVLPARPTPHAGGAAGRSPAALRLRVAGGNPRPRVTGKAALPGKVHYFLGRDPAKWRTNIPTYRKVRCEAVYPGVDLVYYGAQGAMEYDLVVRPGADPAAIRLRYEGAAGARLDARGDLLLRVAGTEVRQHAPLVYQQEGNRRRSVAGAYQLALAPGGVPEVRFALGDYDRRRTLVIDPVLDFSTYLGNLPGGTSLTNVSEVRAVAADARGSAYAAGYANLSPNNDGILFVTKLTPSGADIAYTTYYGGMFPSIVMDIAVDAQGAVYLTGSTGSLDLPVVNAFQPEHGPIPPPAPMELGEAEDAFVAKLGPQGDELVYSSYLGGSGTDIAYGISVDAQGSACVAGATRSPDLPITAGAFQTTLHPPAGQAHDGFVTRIAPDGGSLIYSTFVGGEHNDQCWDVEVDATGHAFVAGGTGSADFPVTPGAFKGELSGLDAFVMELLPDGSAPVYATLLGGSTADYAQALALDPSGYVYVTGYTNSADFPLVHAAQPQRAGLSDLFVACVAPGGGNLKYSTYLGGAASFLNPCEAVSAIAVDPRGNALVTGSTFAADFPLVAAIQGVRQSPDQVPDAFVTLLKYSGDQILFSTYLGGNQFDAGQDIALDPQGRAYLGGRTTSTDFPLAFARQASRSVDGVDGFLLRLRDLPFPAPPPAAPTDLRVVEAGATEIALAWTDQSVSETGFEIERKDGSGDWMAVGVVGAEQTHFNNVELRPGTAYSFRVRAVGNGEASPYSNIVQTATRDILLTPTALHVTAVTPTTVSLAWEDANPHEAGFRIEQRVAGGAFVGVLETGPSTGEAVGPVEVTGLTPNREYLFRVRAIRPADSSEPSDTATALTLPTAPTGLAVTAVSAVRLNLTWTNTTDAGLKLERSLAGEDYQPVADLPAGATRYVETGLQPEQEYHYRLRAFNSSGVSSAVSATGTTLAAREVGKLVLNPPVKPRTGQSVLDLGKVPLGTTRERDVVIKNVGRRPLEIQVSEMPPPLSITSGAGTVTLAPGARHRVTVHYRPTERGNNQSFFTVYADDLASSPVTVIVRGTGVQRRRRR